MQYLSNKPFSLPASSGKAPDWRWDLVCLTDDQFLAKWGKSKTEYKETE